MNIECLNTSSINLSEIIITISTVALAIYAGIQVWLLRRDVRETRISRNASVVLKILEIMDDTREKWHQVYELPDNHNTWDKDQLYIADLVGVQLQRVAYLAETGLFDEKYLLENYAKVFSKCWDKLENFIRDYREKCGEPRTIKEGAFQRRHFELIAGKSKKYQEKYPTKS